ncbi:MAG: SurA N-terminal domain-containing protein [Rhodanobacter sp.]|jgi:peptidyl-prolyl cis-trans isomerase D|nr:SurA N-terminal domain-containing protein [Rhodanobacter sp.]
MLQLLRGKKSQLLVKIVLVLITIGFSFFGIESYFVASTNTSVAKIDNTEISQDQFRERMTRLMAQVADASVYQKPEVKKQVLDQLINEQVLIIASDKLGVRVPDERIRQEISMIPAFQSNGKFDPDIYRKLLNGLSPQDFEQRMRQDLTPRELPQLVSDTALVTDAEVDNYLSLKDQRRDLRYMKLDKPVGAHDSPLPLGDVVKRLNKFAAESEISAEEIDDYYKAHSADFMTPEQVALNYIELDGAKLAINTVPDDNVLKERYEKEKARFVTNEQRLASHILVKIGSKDNPDDQKKALAKAQDIQKDLKSGKDFAEVAKKESDDLGSKNQGGDLDWVSKDGSTEEAFQSALFALKKDEISDPVLSSEGYHIIQLRDIRPGKTRTFEEVKPELAKEYANSERDRVYSEKAGKLTDLTYQNPASLDPAAKELNLIVQKTPLFSRMGGGIGIAANPAVGKAAFSDDVLVQNNNSGAIDLGPNHIVVVRIADHKPTTPIPLEQVRDQIRTKILAERTTQQAKDAADALFARLGKGETLDQLASEKKLKIEEQKGIGREAANLDSALVKAVFLMPRPQAGKPEYRLVPLAGDSYALLQLDGVVDGDPSKLDAKTKEAARTTLTQAAATAASHDFINALRNGMTVRIFDDKMQQEL